MGNYYEYKKAFSAEAYRWTRFISSVISLATTDDSGIRACVHVDILSVLAIATVAVGQKARNWLSKVKNLLVLDPMKRDKK